MVHFQPYGTDTSTQEPLAAYWIGEFRLEGGPIETDEDLPVNLIGKEAEDTLTGIKGIIVSICLHINGCVHANIARRQTKPGKGFLPPVNADIRQLKGKDIPRWSEKEKAASRKEKPSPIACSSYTPRLK
jgi:hypothetical protein